MPQLMDAVDEEGGHHAVQENQGDGGQDLIHAGRPGTRACRSAAQEAEVGEGLGPSQPIAAGMEFFISPGEEGCGTGTETGCGEFGSRSCPSLSGGARY